MENVSFQAGPLNLVFIPPPLDGSVGRADDVIILASGEKTVPAPMESIIASSPLVQGVVMFGRERNQVGVLIEPRPEHAIDVNDEKAVAEFRNKIWYALPLPLGKSLTELNKGTRSKRPTSRRQRSVVFSRR